MKVYIILHTFEGTDKYVSSEIHSVYANKADALIALADLYNEELKFLANYNIEPDEYFDDNEDAMEFEINGDVYSSAQIIEEVVIPASERAICTSSVYTKAVWLNEHYEEIAPAVDKALKQVAEKLNGVFDPDDYITLSSMPVEYLTMAYDILKPPHLKNVSIEEIKVTYVENYGWEDPYISEYLKKQGITPHQFMCISGEGLLDIWYKTYGMIK